MTSPHPTVFGIDLGTTYSCIAFVDEAGQPVVVPNRDSERVTPSVVMIDGDQVVVGTAAKKRARACPDRVFEMVKRRVGFPGVLFECDGRTYRPEEILSLILRKVAGDAATTLGKPVEDVVITCPAHFGIKEREAIHRAGEIAGLKVRALLNEPTAAALAYGLNRTQPQTVLVFDLGGGTFDVTVLDIREDAITVACTSGEPHLGGRDWDHALVEYFERQYRDQTGSDEAILDDSEILQDLFLQAEQAKMRLSHCESYRLIVTGRQRVRIDLRRETFEQLTRPLLERAIARVREVLIEAERKGCGPIDRILLVGGATRMPRVASRLIEEFRLPLESFDPDEAVAKGAAIHGWMLCLDKAFREVLAREAPAGPPSEAPGPGQRERASKVLATELKLSPTLVQDGLRRVTNVSSKTFGVVARDRDDRRVVYHLLRRNDPLPAECTRVFYTTHLHQKRVHLRLMEGLTVEAVGAVAEDTQIGEAWLDLPTGLPDRAPIHVTFRLTEQGRLVVVALEPSSRVAKRVEVETTGVISEADARESHRRTSVLRVS